jgi:histidyl-tRNA synthetase
VAGRKLQAPKGTFDVLPDDGNRRVILFHLAEEIFGGAGYGFAETPVFEDTELFARGVGEATDIVQKEMFTFEDQGGRSLTLRPEGTAGICRAYVEHGMHKLPQPVKLWYWGPFFRHEAPQAGRYRQFTQVGLEAVGSDDPSLDAESILLLARLLEVAHVRGLRLRISSLGTPETRRSYSDELRDYLRGHEADLSEDVRERLDANPLRAFDSDHPGTKAVMADAPRLIDRLVAEDAEHFAEVRSLLDEAGAEYEVDGTLVRGLDYYTRTVFEFTSDELGAQSGVGGGGRYDRLIGQLGGPDTPGVGWAAGVERILLAAEPPRTDGVELTGSHVATSVFVAIAPGGGRRQAFGLWHRLWGAGVGNVQMEQAGRSLKGQLKHADRLEVDWTLIVGDGALELKDMTSGNQHPVEGLDEVLAALRRHAHA